MTREDLLKRFESFEKHFLGNFPRFYEWTANSNYPPYNIIKESNGDSNADIRLQVSLAGFNENDIEVTFDGSLLTIRANKEEKEDKQYIYRGLATRSFVKSFEVGADYKPSKPTFVDGILEIVLENKKEPAKVLPIVKATKTK